MITRLMISSAETRLVPEGEPVEVTSAYLCGAFSAAASEREAVIQKEMVNPIIINRVIPYTYEQRQDPLFEPDVEQIWLYMPQQVGDKLRLAYDLWNDVFSERDRALKENNRLRVRIEQMHESSWWRRLLRKYKAVPK